METLKVRVTRAFCIGGKRQEVEKTLTLPKQLARELIANGKAEAAPEAPQKAQKGDDK